MSSNLRNVLDPKVVKVAVSSTTPGSSKKNLINPSSSDEDQPWSANVPSHLHLTFPEPISATHFALTFQGGFVATSAAVWVARVEDRDGKAVGLGLMMGGKVYPEDRNKRQVFEIPFPQSGLATEEEEPTSATNSGPNIVTEVLPDHATTPQKREHAQRQHEEQKPPLLTELKIEFEKSSDQYGRVTLYSIEVLGA
ncbi:hypothetical protein CI109_104578 [Kwoniella shandongensis]|uniref:Uncharacterized protein n=1 Tax=Kwoniella shandongensis TaxID=1734106 RepID=A0A5M6BTA8_9TREE|nr:uncharacterized protein CI109_005532 [Kwoniella shandongensis]KAA5526098.1 hypothetical protein CI109_005532 [Kwoniella shandongensis]